MNKNFNCLSISDKNCFTFSKANFDLSLFYTELSTFYKKVGFDNDIYYAHSFNKDGLFSSPYPISGFPISKLNYNSSFFSLFSDKDITFATDMENNKLECDFNSKYKYNILSLYDSLLKAFEGYNNYNPLFNNKKIENDEFFLFLSKYCLNIPQFVLFKEEFFQ
jgi:hypothetical protein